MIFFGIIFQNEIDFIKTKTSNILFTFTKINNHFFMKIARFIIVFITLIQTNLFSQQRVITTGAPFLRISPDARAGGMADMGVATSPDAFAQYWNPSKNAFNQNDMGIGISYTPYLNKLTNDIFLLNASYFTHLGEEKNSVLGASLYYFNMGEIALNQLGVGNVVNPIGRAKPNEFSFDVSYGLKLSEYYSMAVALRYIRSDLFNGLNEGNSVNGKAANTFAVDLSGYFLSNTFTSFSETEGRVRAGFNVSNIGPKLNYSNSEINRAYLPTNFRLGAGYDVLIGEDHTIAVTTEINKLLVPTPNQDGTIPDVSALSAVFNSWGDAPGGFSEELKEITTSLGVEYNYLNSFFVRTGYYNENKDKGGRKFLSLGLGLKYQTLGVDFAYLIPTSAVNNALENTLRFSITWNFLTEEEE